jgi:hypothetical protein
MDCRSTPSVTPFLACGSKRTGASRAGRTKFASLKVKRQKAKVKGEVRQDRVPLVEIRREDPHAGVLAGLERDLVQNQSCVKRRASRLFDSGAACGG